MDMTQPVIVALSFSTVSVAAAVIDVTIADIFGAYILRHAVWTSGNVPSITTHENPKANKLTTTAEVQLHSTCLADKNPAKISSYIDITHKICSITLRSLLQQCHTTSVTVRRSLRVHIHKSKASNNLAKKNTSKSLVPSQW
jgi:hypothetical protein